MHHFTFCCSLIHKGFKFSFFPRRLASVQEHRTPQIPTKQVGGKIPSDDDKRALLDNIKAMVPDHQARLMKLEVQHPSIVNNIDTEN